MKDKPLSIIMHDIFNGRKFEEITTVPDIVSYFIDGTEVDKATWKVEQKSAEEEEMKKMAGAEETADL